MVLKLAMPTRTQADDLTFGDYATATVDGKRIEGRGGRLNPVSMT